MTRRILVTLLAGLTLAGPAGAQPDAPSKNPMTTPPDIHIADSNFTVVNTDDIRLVTEGIETHLRRALEHADPADAGQAARDLRKAAAGVRMEAARAPRGDRPLLAAAGDTLDGLAAQLERNPFWSETRIRMAAAGTHLSLAEHLWRLARSAWEAHDAGATGRDMEAAVDHVGSATEWRAVGLPLANVSRLESIRRVSVSMQTDETGWESQLVDPALADLKATLDGLESGALGTPASGTKG